MIRKSRRWSLRRRPDALRDREQGPAGGQARLRREASDLAGGRSSRADRAGTADTIEADGRPSAGVPPGRCLSQGDARPGPTGRAVLHVHAAGQPRHRPPERERLVVAGAARHLGHLPPAWAPSRCRLRPMGNAISRRASRTWSSPRSSSPTARWRTSTCSWLDPHKIRKMTVVGPREDGHVRRHGGDGEDPRLRQRGGGQA